jgi:hypothetical protein
MQNDIEEVQVRSKFNDFRKKSNIFKSNEDKRISRLIDISTK